MGYDLSPLAPDAEEGFHFGAFSWPWMLDAGVGLVIGTGPALQPASFTYQPDPEGLCVRYNDRALVTEEQAKLMAVAARGLVSVERFKRREFDKLPASEQAECMKFGAPKHYLNLPARDDFVDKVERFADWAEKSGGFEVH